MSSQHEITVSRPRLSWLARARRRAFLALPLLVWLGAAGGVALLLRERSLPLPCKALAETSRYLVHTPLDAQIAALNVAELQPVAAGQVLGLLHDEAIRLQLARARLDLEQLRAELAAEQESRRQDKYQSQVDRDVELRRLHGDLETARVDALRTKAEIEEARVLQQGFAVDLQRQEALGETIATGTELNRLRTERDRYGRRVQELQELLAGQEQRRDHSATRLREFSAASRPSIDDDLLHEPFRFRIREQEVALEEITLALQQHRLIAPADGVVEQVWFRKGERVRAGDTLIAIVEPRARAVVAWVPEAVRARIAPGMRAALERADLPGQLRPTIVARVAPALALVPARLWTDPRVEEWAVPVWFEASGDEVPGQRMLVHWRQ